MKSLRLRTIASFVSYGDSVIDIGCDHAYLPIYLVENKICAKAIATDIHAQALLHAENNIAKHGLSHKITTILSDGLDCVSQINSDTIILAGMGTSTILHILKKVSKKYIKKLIIQSNNDLYLLRTSLLKKGYYLEEEKVIFEKGHYYVIGCYTLKFHFLSLRERLFGKYKKENLSYYQFLLDEYNLIYTQIHRVYCLKKIKTFLKMKLLKKYL